MADQNNNPLDQFVTYTVKYVLAAFAYTQDAASSQLDKSSGKPGSSVSGGCGGGVVLVNDFVSNLFSIDRFESDFSFYGSLTPSTSQMMGAIRIFDRFGGYFPTFLATSIGQLGSVSETHAAYALRIFFVGTDHGGAQTVVPTKPLVFNMVTLIQNFSDYSSHIYTMFFAASFNTTGQFPGFSKLYQTTITNQDGNPSSDIPKPDVPGSSIIPRGTEDGQKSGPRQQRIDKSKTMQTLQDVFEGMTADLMQQKYVHKRQLQEWLGYVRDDYVKKINPPQQKKTPDPLPVDYELKFEDKYNSYQIDNRNMPFEQPEQSQLSKGIRVINLGEGQNIPVMFDELLKLSTQIAKDFRDSQYTYKTVFPLIRQCDDKYHLYMKVKQIKHPSNSQDKDSGPGDGPAPLVYYFQKTGTDSDLDVMSLSGKLNSNIALDMLEQQVDDPDAKVVYGNREQATAERNASLNFFKTFFSGVRMNVSNKNNSGEFADYAGVHDNMLMPNINAQSNVFSLVIDGNSDIFSDIHRNPVSVANEDSDGAVHYQFPEWSPMYLKALINLTPIDYAQDDTDDNISELYYYTNYYHLYRVKTTIDGSNFQHELGLLRTDNIA